MTKNQHMVPGLVLDKVYEMYNELNSLEVRENFAMQLEAIQVYCDDCLKKFAKMRQKEMIKRKQKVRA